ncbi:ExbD/TolR family protein [Kordiimonas pumila]|uniref:ExbD/TolR family protein n=1 Tax=Kordiimonas pumila TaxID=2161677 RepID=A0ABV7D5F3_9PROT|nr:biopolymer transporter ExbD [Kordiimonas pumila]
MRYRTTTVGEAKPDMTPMLDIVFIMLIFFIVTAQYVSEHGLHINHPEPMISEPSNSPNQPLIFQVSDSNSFIHQTRPIDIWSVEALMKQKHTEKPDLPVVLLPSENSHIGMLIRLVDGAKKAGYTTERIVVK